MGGIYFRVQVTLRDKLASLQGAPLSVLMAIACHWDGAGSFPSISQISRETGYSIRMVMYALKTLESGGWITHGRRQGKRNYYKVTTNLLQMGATSEIDCTSATGCTGEIDCTSAKIAPVQKSTHTSAMDCTTPVQKSTENQCNGLHPLEETIEEETTRNKPKKKPAASEKPAGCAWCLRPRKEMQGVHFLLQKYHDLYRQHIGQCPTILPPRDGGILGRLMSAGRSEGEIVSAMELFLRDPDGYSIDTGYSLRAFATRFDGLRLKSTRGSKAYGKVSERRGTNPAHDPRI